MRRGLRKQWRYVAAFTDPFMVCVARIQVGPLAQTFWAIIDREAGEIHERTRMRMPGARGEVWREEREGVEVDRMLSEDKRLDIRVGDGKWAEATCDNDGHEVWTRKRCDVPVHVGVRIGEQRWELDGRGVEDESTGHHPRHTEWRWSAGVGRATDGRSVGWNLVEGINDPPQGSERAIWINGEPSECGPSQFDGLDAISFEDGSRLEFSAEQERRADQNLLYIRSAYRQPFGTFRGTLPGGIELESGMGVMEYHDAWW